MDYKYHDCSYQNVINNSNNFDIEYFSSKFACSDCFNFYIKYIESDSLSDRLPKEFRFIGYYYEHIDPNINNMIKYYELGAIYDDIDCMFDLAKYYQLTEQYDKMKTYYNMAITNGDSSSMTNLAQYYKNVEKNYELMEKYYLIAIYDVSPDKLTEKHKNLDYDIDIDFANVTALYNLGLYYQERKQFQKMIKCYKCAIQKHDSDAMFNLGKYYELNNDYLNMLKYYRMAIDNDDVDAMYALGKFYQDIDDCTMMEKYYEMAVNKHNDINSMMELAKYYSDLSYKTPQFRKYIKMACDTDSLKAIIMYAHWSENNLRMMRYKCACYGNKTCLWCISDYQNAIKYYRLAIDKNDIESMYRLGMFYIDNGDLTLAEQYLLMAHNNDHKNATNKLILLYERIDHNLSRAIPFMIKLCDSDADMMLKIANYYKSINNESEMKKYYLMADAIGNSHGLYQLAKYYEDNNNGSEAEKYYEICAINGHKTSMFALGNYYRKQNNKQQAIKYYMMSVENNSINGLIELTSYMTPSKIHCIVKNKEFVKKVFDAYQIQINYNIETIESIMTNNDEQNYSILSIDL